MEIRQLQYFQAVAHAGNMSAAARELHVSQPTLSMTISRLEEDLGVHLFDRVGGKIQLNRMGEDLLENTERVLWELREMRMKAEGQSDSGHNEVNFGFSTAGFSISLINAYLDRYPPMVFRHFHQNREILAKHIEDGSLDFAVSKGKLQGTGIQWIPLVEDELLALVSLDHPLARRDSVYVSDLLEYPFVLNHADISNDGDFQRLFAGYDRQPKIQMMSQESAVVMEATQRGLGVGLASSVLIQCDPRGMLRNAMKPLHIIGAETFQTIGISKLKGHYLSASAQQFYTFAQDFFRGLTG